MFSEEAQKRCDDEEHALLAVASGFSVSNGGHRDLVRKLKQVEKDEAKGFVMALGDTIVHSNHAEDDSCSSQLGKFEAWAAPDIDAFDRRVPREMAYVAGMGFLFQEVDRSSEVRENLGIYRTQPGSPYLLQARSP